MKKMLVCCATLCLALSLFCVSALAGDLAIEVSQADADAVQVTQKTESAEPIFTVKKSGAQSGELYLVMIQQVEQGTDASAKPLPNKENLYYLNVEQATGDSFTTEAYPRDLAEGTYIVYLSDYSGSAAGAAKGVALLSVSAGGGGGGGSSGGGGSETGRKLGDVNNDGNVTPSDAVCALQMYVGIKNRKDNAEVDWTAEEKTAADADHSGDITPSDATMILQYYVGIISEQNWN